MAISVQMPWLEREVGEQYTWRRFACIICHLFNASISGVTIECILTNAYTHTIYVIMCFLRYIQPVQKVTLCPFPVHLHPQVITIVIFSTIH